MEFQRPYGSTSKHGRLYFYQLPFLCEFLGSPCPEKNCMPGSSGTPAELQACETGLTEIDRIPCSVQDQA